MNLSIQNHVRTGVDMKLFISIFLLLNICTISAQMVDSTYIKSSAKVVVKDNQILTHFAENDLKKPANLMHYDGLLWKRINQDSIPTIDHVNSHLSFSEYSDHIFVTGKHFLWEYDGKNWTKHSINDSLDGKRIFYEIIELPDTSFMITAVTEFVKYTSGNTIILDKMFHEVLQFKNGVFTTIKSRWTDKNTLVGAFNSFQKFKVQPNGNYSYYTPIETSIPDRGWEIVTFNLKHEIVKKDTNPDLSSFGFNTEFTEFNDYIYDTKGSLWFPVKTIQTDVFACLAEKRANGEIYLYGENIGLPKTSGSYTYCLDLDEKDNIWFHHTYRIEFEGGNSKGYHSIFMLDSGKTSLKEFKYDEFMKKSIWYTGGNSEYDFLDVRKFYMIKYRKNQNSLVVCVDYPMLIFYPYRNNTNVKESIMSPIHLYPNPVQSNNTITIASSAFENVLNPLNVVIRDISGANVREEIISTIGQKLQFTTQDLVNGTYFVSVMKNNKTILQTKFIKE